MRVWGLGVCTVDQLIIVDQYPAVDSKTRAKGSVAQCGGNVGNTLCAIKKLLSSYDTDRDDTLQCTESGSDAEVPLTAAFDEIGIISKVGGDNNGRQIEDEFVKTGIDCSKLLKIESLITSVTYIIVDVSTSTRTCINVPMTEDLTTAETDAIINDHLLGNQPLSLLHFDSRHTVSALSVAQALRCRSPSTLLSIDAEKDRPPHFKALLGLCDLIFTSEAFLTACPLEVTYTCDQLSYGDQVGIGSDDSYLQLIDPSVLYHINTLVNVLLCESHRSRIVVSTFGPKGCLAVRRRDDVDTRCCDVSEECSRRNHDFLSIIQELENSSSASSGQLRIVDLHCIATDISRGTTACLTVTYCAAWEMDRKSIVDTTG